jgi:hypothetical protein
MELERKTKKKKRGEQGADDAPRVVERRCMDCINSGVQLKIDKATECNKRWPRGKDAWNVITGA